MCTFPLLPASCLALHADTSLSRSSGQINTVPMKHQVGYLDVVGEFRCHAITKRFECHERREMRVSGRGAEGHRGREADRKSGVCARATDGVDRWSAKRLPHILSFRCLT